MYMFFFKTFVDLHGVHENRVTNEKIRYKTYKHYLTMHPLRLDTNISLFSLIPKI